MTCRGRTILVWTAAAALMLTFAIVWRSREPREGGKSVNQWLRDLKIGVKVMKERDGSYVVMLPNLSDQELAGLRITPTVRTFPSNWMLSRFFTNWPDQVDFSYKPDEAPANQAIKRMGVAALPYLKGSLRSRESPFKNLLCQRVWPLLPGSLQRRIGKPIHPLHKRLNAAYALGLLGAAAMPAVPELQRLVREDKDSLVRAVALESLHRIDPAGAGPFYPELFEQPRAAPPETAIPNTNSSRLFDVRLSL